MSSSEYRDTIELRLTREGTTGIGAGAPIVRYHESAASGSQALEGLRAFAATSDPWRVETFLGDAFRQLEGQYAARAALDIALHDWVGQKLGIPVYRLLGLDPAEAPLTTFSIGIDTPGDHAPEGARGGRVPGAEDQGRARQRRGHDRRRPQRHRQAAAGGRQRGLEGQGDGHPPAGVAGPPRRRARRAADARGHARGGGLAQGALADPALRRRGLPARDATSRACAEPATASTSRSTRPAACARRCA